MASNFQQQALQRKLIYAALILVLWFAAYTWRTADFSLFGMPVRGVDKQALDLAIREESRGDVDLLGTIVRITTLGSRGVASCVVWIHAMDAQKKNEWNILELNVRSLTKLQNHYITPWLFQGWNLAYNVSVESDRISDKYFFISRGLQLLAEGERENHDNPDIRWSLGFFMQHKIIQSDETNTLRSISQLSMIPPNERDPGRFVTKTEGGQEKINLKELEDFCKEHPQLVRRLREGMSRQRRIDQMRQFHIERADELVQFLRDNYRVPSWWVEPAQPSDAGMWRKKQDELRPLADRFPVLPPKHTTRPFQQPPATDTLTNESQLRDEDDANSVAQAWFSYAQEPLPKPEKLPGQSEPIENPLYQRLPRRMTTVIFRDYPAQSQRFAAERLQEEGWFDESGWAIPDWFAEQRDTFLDGEPAIVGRGRKWSGESWQRAVELWTAFGEANHLKVSETEFEDHMARARAFGVRFGLTEWSAPPQLRPEDQDDVTLKELFSFMFMQLYNRYRTLTNFPYHYNNAVLEARGDVIQIRKTLYEANMLRMKNAQAEALAKYRSPTGLKAWRDQVMLVSKDFRDESLTQEQAFENQMRFVDLYVRQHGRAFKAQAAQMLLMPSLNLPVAGVCPLGLYLWAPAVIGQDADNPLLGGPFDCLNPEGQELIAPMTRDHVLKRLFPTLYNAEPAGGNRPQQPALPGRR